MMANRRTPNTLTSKPSRYLYAVLVGGTGVILFVLGFIIPGWVWLVWVGFAFILAAIYYVMVHGANVTELQSVVGAAPR